MKNFFAICTILLAMSFSVNAQNSDRKWSIGLSGGISQYAGDMGSGFYRFDKAIYGNAGLSFSRYISRYFDVSLDGNYGEVGYFKTPQILFRTRLLNINGNLRFKFLGKEDKKLTPFLFAGIGYMGFKDMYNDERSWNNMALPEGGIGLNWDISPLIALQLKETFIYSDYDQVDRRNNGANDAYLQHSLGLNIKFGKAKDTDMDGVPDRKDKCLNVKGLPAFEGCPDTDNDGVIDQNDQCPNTPANVSVDASGCPLDKDGDGTPDYLDNCPEVKGIASLSGCPDADNDGITDLKDNCPGTPAGVKVDANGCPLDRDKDGIADYLDKCPDAKGLPELDGCPDSDGDGIADKDDKCPQVKGTKENKGCPEVKAEVKEVFKKALQGIQFETGKDVIRPTSFPILNNVVKIMNENKEYNLIINGHTDNVGKPESNLILSQKRADAVMNYLITKGVEASRMKAIGYGDTKPVADNNTVAGRAQNRRVEFVVEF